MSRIQSNIPFVSLRLAHTALKFDISWLVILPAFLLFTAILYVPILGSFLNSVDTWVVVAVSTLLCGTSLVGHTLAHIIVANANRSEIPAFVPIYPLGDAAQIWPASQSAQRDALVALAGPFGSALLAVLAYLLWNAQLHPYLNISLPLVIFFNGALALINLIPAYPLDGGRLLRAIGWGLLLRPELTTRWALNMGYIYVALLSCWALYLIVQRAYLGLQTGLITLSFAGLLLLPLLRQPAWRWEKPASNNDPVAPYTFLRTILAWFLITSLLAFTISLLPIVGGIEIPGVSPSVAPMVEIPPEYSHPFSGKFILTTVILQTPITVGEWAFAHWSPLVNLVPPEQIVPPDTTPQEVAQRQFRMLDESEITAIVVGLQLAGYEASVHGNGVKVVSILPESPAQKVLQPGDVIFSVNGEQVTTTSELTNRLRDQTPLATVQLQIMRNDTQLDVAVPLMPSVEANAPPRIGIVIESAGLEADLPFPVEIVPQKIVGGPSAGLMFTLTVYNLVTPGDLTNGHIIAGTGTIALDGTVGPIGGVEQKVAGAEIAGAEYFLAPPENYEDALAAAQKIHVIQVATVDEAIHFLQRLPPVEPQQ